MGQCQKEQTPLTDHKPFTIPSQPTHHNPPITNPNCLKYAHTPITYPIDHFLTHPQNVS
ncbi:MAG: hypothetical protein AVDCRST_MAG56-7345 [uncultured Cytophagales bacterium]|uniref:Uncharacterized protein n=1 Tax=uncultured Cytophagales bacterium TaxID=158755 RepID=A0A6J4LDZ3_9SPHI|nr:MAG: hypothetical protein AVDCRST_MAG56-7345 [uncultured Cytophagales bacterium]